MTAVRPSGPLRLGMVGGGQDAFIGAVHRTAARLDGEWTLVAGALSSTPERALASGAALGLDRTYPTWEAMLAGELARPSGERIDAVSIVTPNHVHFPVARAFAQAGIHVICDKPLVHTSAQADELRRVAAQSGVVFAVTYNYSGYPLIRHARDLVRDGALGEIRKVIVEYHQGWLATRLEEQNSKQADWRTDPARSGVAGAVGDIGSHAEQLIATVTGLHLEALCADLTTFVPGRRLDDDASVLLRFQGGARGVLLCSQVALGEENALRLRVYGTHGSLAWDQEHPNQLHHVPRDAPRQTLTRGGPGLSAAAQAATRLPAGHPEAFLEAFANLYRGVAEAVRARAEGRAPDPLIAQFPDLTDGARGVHFIEKTVESSRSDRKWTDARWPG
ncbi:Gfo/Idh/MocA family oxidoreductase (plasmid) [Deinococcus taeanensis]|uniref:Gfo/Idh/MocA family protein n=1 Tax=Deinococcus taeanensis TaxID=2737050 RepID=UPI001CDBEB42|nr:Gfo/Idh/MocA family oxidoreductase [Deinococcus taeanensis]UBV44868.1 Gfo/Idh/MocA family oxidoreductase [Deinococcus taeanensis]